MDVLRDIEISKITNDPLDDFTKEVTDWFTDSFSRSQAYVSHNYEDIKYDYTIIFFIGSIHMDVVRYNKRSDKAFWTNHFHQMLLNRFGTLPNMENLMSHFIKVFLGSKDISAEHTKVLYG
jgi:hypothetical protein